ncbi:hypothetical protein O6H91_13G103400 [Diphasiastrum complanatum]|uniref:Uncharacterized protein n=1 Tax=Diphasiastrum complanatum TaxID=34168 RepID=A0ACC2BXX6_DIPCM|nr:hypothetical protein O6H91_13G103400 [Diphasiastrum complanatum]
MCLNFMILHCILQHEATSPITYIVQCYRSESLQVRLDLYSQSTHLQCLSIAGHPNSPTL